MKHTIQIQIIRCIFLPLLFTAAFSCQNSENKTSENEMNSTSSNSPGLEKKEVTINYYGHSCFMITTPGGTKVLTDPVEFKGYHMPEGIKPDIVTVSHNHIDHNRTDVVAGNPEIILGCTSDHRKVTMVDRKIEDVKIYTVPSYHDPGKHGVNAIFVYEFDGIRIVHLGDLGTTLSESQIEAIGEVDILMIPVGGQFTISGSDADEVIRQLNVKSIVLPMHYKTEAFSLPYSAEDFMQGKDNCKRISGNTVMIDISNLPQEREIVVMDYQ